MSRRGDRETAKIGTTTTGTIAETIEVNEEQGTTETETETTPTVTETVAEDPQAATIDLNQGKMTEAGQLEVDPRQEGHRISNSTTALARTLAETTTKSRRMLVATQDHAASKEPKECEIFPTIPKPT